MISCSSSPTPSLLGDVRIGPLLALPQLLQEHGCDPQQVFSAAGLSPSSFTNPEQRIAFDALGLLMQASVQHSGCVHFGLLLGERFSLQQLGLLGELMRNAPTVGAALSCLSQYLPIYDRGAVPLMLELPALQSLLGYSIYHRDLTFTKPLHDAAIAISYRILRELCGPAWTPLRVQFSCKQPRSTQAYRRLFKCSLHFDAEIPGVIFDSHWLAHPVAGADPFVHARTSATLAATPRAMGLGEQVERILLHLLPSGRASSLNVARELGISERTLRRRLEDEGSKLQHLLSQTRYEIARQLLLVSRLPIADIASSLQYEDANAFSRAFKRWAGVSPLRWRHLQEQQAVPGCPVAGVPAAAVP